MGKSTVTSSRTSEASGDPRSEPVGHAPPEPAINPELPSPADDGGDRHDDPGPPRRRLPQERRPHHVDEVEEKIDVDEPRKSRSKLIAREEDRGHEHRDLEQAGHHLLNISKARARHPEQRHHPDTVDGDGEKARDDQQCGRGERNPRIEGDGHEDEEVVTEDDEIPPDDRPRQHRIGKRHLLDEALAADEDHASLVDDELDEVPRQHAGAQERQIGLGILVPEASPDEAEHEDEDAEAEAGPEGPEHRPAVPSSDLLPAETAPHPPRRQALGEVGNGNVVLRIHPSDTSTSASERRAFLVSGGELLSDDLNRDLPAPRAIELREDDRLEPPQGQLTIVDRNGDAPPQEGGPQVGVAIAPLAIGIAGIVVAVATPFRYQPVQHSLEVVDDSRLELVDEERAGRMERIDQGDPRGYGKLLDRVPDGFCNVRYLSPLFGGQRNRGAKGLHFALSP